MSVMALVKAITDSEAEVGVFGTEKGGAASEKCVFGVI
jgi:hypothetical protein